MPLELPLLTRVVLLQIEAKHTPSEAADGLTGRLRKDIRVELREPLPDDTNPRIHVTVSLDGEWLNKATEELVISVKTKYEGRLVFSGSPSMAEVVSWLDDDFYRNSVIAQAYIPANAHLLSQLEMMGLRTSRRPLGYKPEGTFKRIEDTSLKPRRRRTKKAAN